MTDLKKLAERFPLLNPAQIACMTQFTKTGERDMKNRKPYRSKELKAEAKRTAFKNHKGYYTSTTRVLYH